MPDVQSKDIGIPQFAIELGATPFAIGLFIMDWSKHEREMIRIIAHFEGVKVSKIKPELLDGQLSRFESRLRAAAEHVEDSETQRLLLEVIDEHARLREIRNDIVHGYWPSLNKEERFIHRRKRRGEPEASQVFGAKEIIAERDAISEMNGKTFELLRAIGVLPSPSRP